MQVTTGFKLGSSKVAYTLSFINTTIIDVNSAFSPDHSVLKFCSTAIHCRSTADVSLAIRSHPPSSVIRIVFCTRKEVYEACLNPYANCPPCSCARRLELDHCQCRRGVRTFLGRSPMTTYNVRLVIHRLFE